MARALTFWANAATRYLSRLAKLGTEYYFFGGGGAINAGVLGTFYLPSFSAETSVLGTLSTRLYKLVRVLADLPRGGAIVETRSTATHTWVESTADYIFTDPPFGGNLMYSELNFLWEAWLRVFTNNKPEAIENEVQGKTLAEYQRLMTECFKEYYRWHRGRRLGFRPHAPEAAARGG
jgi:16S rRNA G966 N2-methylase RsmD